MEKEYKNIRIENYNYLLPEERIAKYPKENREESKLLYFTDNEINTYQFKEFPDLLEKSDLLIFNNAKVIQARLAFQKQTGANIEIFCLEPHHPADYNLAFQAKGECEWKCLVGNLKKWKEGKLSKSISINGFDYKLEAEKVIAETNFIIIKFSWSSSEKDTILPLWGDILENSGITPLPPYLNREAEQQDKTRYQTIYAKNKGSVAAPTAGLHFTENVFKKIVQKGINYQNITLHVSAGTFRPVKSSTIEGHEMHEEHFEVNLECLNAILNHENGRIIAIGTTSVRTLESIYWIGVKLIDNENNPFNISQWEVYQKNRSVDLKRSLETLKKFMVENNIQNLQATTRIIIVPGYDFKVINGLVTNFHQPQSTLLLLIAAVVGEKWKNIYNYALENDYRFLSYGDSSFLLNHKI